MKRKLLHTIFLLMITCAFLAGCGKDETLTDVAGLKINEDMSVESIIIENFDTSLYDLAELQDMIVKEAAEYCTEHGAGSVSALPPELVENNVKVTMTYKSAADYADFNNRRLYIDSLDKAINDGKVNVAFVSVKDNTLTDITTLDNLSEYNIIITDEPGYITGATKVAYVSDGVEIVSKRQVLVTEDMEGLAYIIFEKK